MSMQTPQGIPMPPVPGNPIGQGIAGGNALRHHIPGLNRLPDVPNLADPGGDIGTLSSPITAAVRDGMGWADHLLNAMLNTTFYVFTTILGIFLMYKGLMMITGQAGPVTELLHSRLGLR